MRERLMYWGIYLSVFLLLPYCITYVVNGAETALLNKSFDMEKSIPFLLSLQIPESYEEETLKAQAVIVRNNLYYELLEKDFLNIFREIKNDISGKQGGDVEKLQKFLSYPQKIYQKAVLDTENMVLTYEKEIKRIPFHLCSGGKTRNGEEAFRSAEYSYLTAVDSGFDKECEDYIDITYVQREDLSEDIRIKECDESGYVISLEVNDHILEGESFRKSMNLPSSNFEINKAGEGYQIISRGKGHGVGFSQYGGNEMAKKGKKWDEILNIYFPVMEIENVDEMDNAIENSDLQK